MTAITTPQDLLMPLTLLSPSPTNPRTRMNEAELASLAESIAQHGVMQPLLVRRIADAVPGQPQFEIVAGHRRWQACNRLAEAGRNPHGQAIPAVAHALTDAQVLAMQLVENIQRADLHPLDEAAHYRRMRDDATAPASVEDIAQAAKVSVARVYERLSLLHLVDAARDAFLAEKLSLKTALQVARLPAAHQAEVAQHLSDWAGEPMTPKAAAAFISSRYMLRLATAPFDPTAADLLPDTPACGACPKRTGANPQLFADITEADTCTDTTCFAAKKAAQRARVVDELRATGYTVLEAEAAREACTPDGRNLKPNLLALDAPVPYHLGDADLKVSEVLDKAKVQQDQVLVVDHPNAPAPMVAVGVATLEGALRRIKAHREQLNKAAEKAAAKKAPQPDAAPAPASTEQQACSGAEAAAGDEDGAAREQMNAAQQEEAHQALMRELLAFKPPPTHAGLYRGLTPKAYQQQQEQRARAILAAGAITTSMRKEGTGLPPFKLPQMLNVLMWWSDAHLSLAELCRLCGVPQPPDPVTRGSTGLEDTQTEWLWNMPDAQAETLAMAWLAVQDGPDTTPVGKFAEAICVGLGIEFTPFDGQAKESVAEHLQLGALENGEPAAAGTKATGKGAAVRYRCPATGSSWSGRGKRPAWLNAAIAAGRSLSDFEV